jgi:phosphoglycerate dehydrogenase-like enzyme
MLRIVLVGGAADGADRVRSRLPDADVRCVDRVDAGTLVGADAVVACDLPRAVLADATSLRLIQAFGAGVDGIDLDAVPAACSVCNLYEHDVAIGEWVLMVMLALTRRLLAYDRSLRRGQWGLAHTFAGPPERDLRGQTVGVIGLGTIGAQVARLAHAVGMDVVAVTRTPDEQRRRALGLSWLRSYQALADLLRACDFAVVALPLTATTCGMIGAGELALLGPDGYLLNVARGAIVDEDALYDALVSGTIAGAGIDVWYRYPDDSATAMMPAQRPFQDLSNVVMTPHMSGFARSTYERRWNLICDQLACLAEGRRLRNVIAAARAAG